MTAVEAVLFFLICWGWLIAFVPLLDEFRN